MKSTKIFTSLLLLSTIFYSCTNNSDTPTPTNLPTNNTTDNSTGREVVGGWSIPVNEVIGGGPGKDGIPALENPEVITPPSRSKQLSPA